MKRLWYPLIALLVGGVLYYLTNPVAPLPSAAVVMPTPPMKADESTPAVPATATPERPAIAPAPIRRGNRYFYGELPPGVTNLSDLTMVNTPAPDWQKKLRSHLLRSSGDKLKRLELLPQESYIIMDGVEGRNVERVVVTVYAKDGRMNRFFAEVDSESGHVTKTWGGVIHENTQPHQP